MRLEGFFTTAVLCCLCSSVWAQEMTEVQHLDFGTFALWDNTAPRTITVAPDGRTMYSTGVAPDIPAKPGQYLLTGLPANMTFTLGVTVANPPAEGGVILDNSTGIEQGGSPAFTIDHFTTNNPSTDSNGNATLYIGATLTSSGTGMSYGNGPYNGTLDITFYF